MTPDGSPQKQGKLGWAGITPQVLFLFVLAAWLGNAQLSSVLFKALGFPLQYVSWY